MQSPRIFQKFSDFIYMGRVNEQVRHAAKLQQKSILFTCGMSGARIFVDSFLRGFEILPAPALVRLEVIALGPLVPCVDKEQILLYDFRLYLHLFLLIRNKFPFHLILWISIDNLFHHYFFH